MEHPIGDVSQRMAAILAGVGLVVTLVGVGLAVGLGASSELALVEDPAEVAESIATAGLYRVGILGWILVILGDVLRAWAIYVFFKQVNHSVALLAAWFMLLHDAILGFSLVGLVVPAMLVGDPASFALAAAEDAYPLMMALLDAHYLGFNVGLLLFSFHLGLNGVLALMSESVPRVLGVLLIVAFLGYLADSASVLWFADPPAMIKQVVMVPNMVGELAFVGWLALSRGR